MAETSITLEVVRYVIETGKHKTRFFSATTGMEWLTVQDISQAQAEQEKKGFDLLAPATTPEIAHVQLARGVLTLRGMGVYDTTQFEYLALPSLKAIHVEVPIHRACRLLCAL
jgi:HrpA-like RNA helicase